MDSVLELVWILAVAGFYLWNATRKNKAKQARKTASPSDPAVAPRAATPFQDFMRQMEEAMREASGEAATETTPEPEPPSAASPVVVRAQSPVPERRPVPARNPFVNEFHDLGSFEKERSFEKAKKTPHEVHGYGPQNPFSEERFEKLPRGLDITEHAPGHLDAGPHARSRPAPRPISRARRWRQRLQNPKEAQDALVLSEIFGGPWKPRRPHKR